MIKIYKFQEKILILIKMKKIMINQPKKEVQAKEMLFLTSRIKI
jgi:hypothetical protein